MKLSANQSGYVMVIALIIFFGIFTIGMSLVSRSSALLSMQENAKRKVQSFYSSDGQMTLLAQELIDGDSKKYRSKNFLIYDDFNSNGTTFDTGWVQVEPDNENRVDKIDRIIFVSDGNENLRPILKKTFPVQSSDTLIWQFMMKWERNNQDCNTFAFYLQLGKDMSDENAWDNVIVNLRWGDNSATGYSSDEMLGYITKVNQTDLVPAGKGLKVVTNEADIKVIVYFNRKQYDILIDGKEYANKIPFFEGNNNNGEINQMRIFLDNLVSTNFSGCSIDNVSLLKKRADSYSSTNELDFGDFGVEYDVMEKSMGVYTLSTKSYRKDAPTLNKYRTPLYQSIVTQRVVTPTVFPALLKIPVRFYDYHSDRSNIEFEQPLTTGPASKGMVATKLDIDGKPVVSGNSSKYRLSYYIRYWFRETNPKDSTLLDIYRLTQAKNDFSFPYNFDRPLNTDDIKIPDPAKTPKRYACDAFANFVIDTTLTFNHLADGVYEFSSDSFFPIDNMGFGKERTFSSPTSPDNHNFGFAMEMTYTFVKVPNLYFKYKGDDDLWVFINDSLVLDVGGRHVAIADQFYVNDLTNLEDNTAYSMKLFYCERHSSASTIKITTNMALSGSSSTISLKSRTWGRSYGNIY